MPTKQPIPAPAASSTAPAEAQGRFVCPFCGSINQNTEAACPRCGLTNNPATRQATRLRIGPWFVLQRKNAAAPGMRFSMLLSLVQKGQVTPLSIVRGPTTQQLWRFACQVKGLSREFGLCYGCGEEIEPTARLCPRCNRLQEPPPDPNVLLEASPPAGSTMPKRAVPENSDTITAFEEFDAAAIGPEPGLDLEEMVQQHKPRRPPVPMVQPPAAGDPAPEPREQDEEARQFTEPPPGLRPEGEAVLSARDLANAFKVDYIPPGQPRRRFTGGLLKSAAAVLVLVSAGFLIVLYFDRSLRRHTLDWTSETYAGLRQRLDDAWQRHEQEQRPPQPAIPQATGRDETPPQAPQEPPSPTPPEAPVVAADSPTAPTPEPTDRPGEAGLAEAPAPPAAGLDPPRPPEPHLGPIAAGPTEPRPADESRPASAPPASPATPTDLTLEEAREEARRLWRAAIDAESQQDHAAAVRLYEQIRQLPRAAHPAGLDLRLEAARTRAEPD